LGVETLGGVMTPQIPPQYHDSDAQGGNVLDSFGQSAGSGDSRSARRAQFAKDNRSLVLLSWMGFHRLREERAQIEVTFASTLTEF